MNFAIVDDEAVEAEELKKYLEEYFRERDIECSVSLFSDVLFFLSNYHFEFDCIFMDYDMPGLNGMVGSKKLRNLDPNVPIVFVTKMEQYAVSGYEVNAVEYMLKPYEKERFLRMISHVENIIQRNTQKQGSIILSTQEVSVKIPYASLYYVEVDKHNMLYHTERGIYTVRGSMVATKERLPSDLFALCNSGYLVNLAHVSFIGLNYVQVGDDKLVISRAKKKGFIEAMHKFISGESV